MPAILGELTLPPFPFAPGRARGGFTLFEMVLVVAIAVLLAAMVVPSMQGMYNGYQITSAADQVRACWASARSHAMEEGRAYRFSVHPGSNKYRVAPDSSQYWSGSDNPQPEDGDEQIHPLIKEDELPKGVTFAFGKPADMAATDVQDDPAANAVDNSSKSDSNWNMVAVFLPDGTAQEDAELSFQAVGTKPTIVRLGALTGLVTTRTAIDAGGQGNAGGQSK